MDRNQRRHCVLLCFASVLVGCADEKKVPPPAAQRSSPPPAQVVRQEEAQTAVPPRIAATPDRSATQTPHDDTWPPGVPPQDVYKAFASTQANYTLGEASGGPHPDDWFVAMLPQADVDSSAFNAIPPDWANDHSKDSAGVELPAGFTAIEAAGFSSDGWPRRIRCETDGATMSYVPGGSFLQGMDGVDPVAGPAHPADVDSFYIDGTEVTVGQFQRFLELGGASADRRPKPPVNANAPADQPVLGVDFTGAAAYSRWAGKDLPTESEWELAARGPRSFVHPWGNGRAVWERRRVPGQIDSVGSFRSDRSVYDVFDMAGNAREWVADFFHPQAYEQSHRSDGSVIRNWTGPKRPSPANHKVVKGGGHNWELWHRDSLSMRSPEDNVGFRCVLRLSDTEGEAPEANSSSPPLVPQTRRSSGL